MWSCVFEACLAFAVLSLCGGAAVLEPKKSGENDISGLDPSARAAETPVDLTCLIPDGVMPEWRDPSCDTFYRCENYVMSRHRCPEGEAYSVVEGTCVDSSRVDCIDQNQAVDILMRGPAYQNYDKAANEQLLLSLIDTTEASSVLSGLVSPRRGRSKRSILRKMGLAKHHTSHDQIQVTLPESVCEAINHDSSVFESLTNALLLMEARCPSLDCGLPVFNIQCTHENDNEDDDDDDNYDDKDVDGHKEGNDNDDDDDGNDGDDGNDVDDNDAENTADESNDEGAGSGQGKPEEVDHPDIGVIGH